MENLFGDLLQAAKVGEKYTSKIKSPVYTPSGTCPNILELFNDGKTKRLIKEIENSGVSNEEKHFLIEAAKRHTVFSYMLIADYYAHATPEMQNLMGNSALIIIDFYKAIQLGYVTLGTEIAQQYLNTYPNEKPNEK